MHNIETQAIQCDNSEKISIFASNDKSETAVASEDISNAIDDFITEILDLKLNQKSLDAIFKSSENLIKSMQVFNNRIINDSNGMNSVQSLNMAGDFACEKLSKYNTQFKRSKAYQKDDNYVAPKEYSLGLRYETVMNFPSLATSLELVECKYQYISLIETLMSLFKRQDFFDEYIKHNSCHNHQAGVYKDFRDGSVFKSNELFKNHPNSIQIQIGCDDFEVCNPLGSKKTIHKICAVYFTVYNMPRKFLSKANNIFLLCLATTDDLKTEFTDFNDILRPIVNEIAHLEKYGIKINDSLILKGTLASLTYDNLGGNVCLGLVEGFRTSAAYCRICTMPQAECQVMCTEDATKIRNEKMYKKQLEIIENSTEVDYKETQGVKRFCILNHLSYFKIFENINADIMHDLDEGVILRFLKQLFEFMVLKKILSKNAIQEKIQYYNYGYLQRDRVPSTFIFNQKNLNLNASQSKCLFQHVPFIFYAETQKPKLKGIWSSVESLLIVCQVANSSVIDNDDLKLLEDNVKIHLEKKRLFFDSTNKPKDHNLTHYVRIIREMGPVKHTSMKCYERKHKVLKKIASNTRNFKNINKTIATSHQQDISREKNSFTDTFTISASRFTSPEYSDQQKSEILKTFDSVENISEIEWVKFNQYDYRKGLLIYHSKTIFEIEKIFLVDQHVYFFCIQYNYCSYHKFASSIKIKCSNPIIYKIIKFNTNENLIVFEKIILHEELYVIMATLDLKELYMEKV